MLDGRYFHKGYVTRDIARAMASLSDLYDMRFECFEATGAVRTPQGSDSMTVKLALGWHANLEIELIEPLSGYVDIYRELLPEDHMPRFHHSGVLVEDWQRLESDIAARGLPVSVSGDLGEIKFAYVDMRPALGHYVEYMWMSEAMWASRSAGSSSADLDGLMAG